MPSPQTPSTTLSSQLRRLGLTRAAGDLNDLLARAAKERLISHVVLSWNGAPSTTGRVIGSVIDPLLEDGRTTLILARLTHALGTTTRVSFAVSPGSREAPAFVHAAQAVKRIAAQTGAPIELLVERAEMDATKKLVGDLKPSCKLVARPLESWSSLHQALADRLEEHDLVVLYGVAPHLAGDAALARAPLALAERFADVNLLVVYGATVTPDPAALAATPPPRGSHASLALTDRDLIAGANVGIAPGVTSAGWDEDRATDLAPSPSSRRE